MSENEAHICPKCSRLDEHPIRTWDVDRYMATAFVDAVRQTLKDGGYATSVEGGEVGGTFLVGVGARLYTIESDYQIARTVHGYDAVGCGANIALGSLYTTATNRSAQHRINLAIDAAATFSAGVAPPVHIVTTQEIEGER